MTTPRPLPQATLRRLAVAASCDPRTIARVYGGGVVRGLAGDRARVVLRAEGLLVDAEALASPAARDIIRQAAARTGKTESEVEAELAAGVVARRLAFEEERSR